MTAATLPPHADPIDPVARRATDQIDPYALIERAEKLLNTEPHDAVVFALRAQSVARARTADALMARAHFVAGAALMQVGDWSGASASCRRPSTCTARRTTSRPSAR
jgi:hypothetical protein